MAKNFKSWPDQWPRNLNYPQEPVYSLLDHTAARVPNRLAIIFSGMELTYAELKNLADRFANALAAIGLQKGERVAIHLPNCPQFAIAYYGTLKAGCVFTPLSPLLAPKEVGYQLIDSGASTLITLDLLHAGIAKIIPETAVKRVITTSIADCYNPLIAPLKPLEKIPVPDTLDMADLLKAHPAQAPQIEIDVTQDLAHLAYTGGTTGVSKGVMLTHRNVRVNAIQNSNWSSGAQIEMRDGIPTSVFPPGVDPLRDRPLAQDHESFLVVVPWFHAMGTIPYLNTMVNAGITMVVFARFDPKEYLEAIQKYQATGLGGAPQLFIPLLNLAEFDTCDLSSVKYLGSGAAPLPLSILDNILNAFKGVVVEGYGMTECTCTATLNPPDRAKIRPGSVGLPIFDTECKVVDLLTGEDLPAGRTGEICIRGPQVMKGYWNRPEETAGDLKDGWLYTGDIGREDEDGFFFITDRKKDLIIYKGYNVYPRELEEVLFQHPAVEQCAVVGRADAQVGEAPVAFVKLLQGSAAGATASKETLLDHTNSQVAAYKKLRDLIFIDAMPVSPAGKILKRELREKLKQS
jgi:long-chain acyl-CoA synthetase